MEATVVNLLRCNHLLHGWDCTGNGVRHLLLVPVPPSSNTTYSESVVNGAQVFYYSRFGIDENNNTDILIQGLVNSAPYLCCAV